MENNEFVTSIFNKIPTPLILFNQEKEVVWANRIACSLFEKDTLLGEKIEDLFSPSIARYLLTVIEKLRDHKGGRLQLDRDIEIVTPKKGVFYITGTFHLARHNGEVFYLFSFVRTFSEEEGETDPRKLNQIIEQAKDGVIVTDTEGIILYVNKAFENMTGYTSTELLGKKTDILKSGIHPREFYKKLWDTIKSGKSWRGVFKNKKKTGEMYYDESLIFPIRDITGNIVNFAALKRDITERLQMEEELERARAKAEEANIAKSKFISNMSHEIRTPLNAIIGFSQILKDNMLGELNEEQKDAVNNIIVAGEHLLDLINDILELSRIEMGKISLSIDDIDLSSVVKDAITLTGNLAANQDVEIINEANTSVFVKADYTRLRQVILNILSNAIKYNRKGGYVRIFYAKIKEDFVSLGIEDSGIGIPQDKISSLFEPFDRLGRESTDISGTGIGLTISKTIMHLMRGDIRVKSEEGVGTTFWIDIPKSAVFQREVSEDREIEKGAVSKPKGKRKILYIEDNPFSIKLLEVVFQKIPYVEFLSAINGKEGIKLIQEVSPDLVLTDINLPDIDGFEILKILREDEKLKKVPVFAISANVSYDVISKAKSAGFDEYIKKPIDIKELLRIIEKYL